MPRQVRAETHHSHLAKRHNQWNDWPPWTGGSSRTRANTQRQPSSKSESSTKTTGSFDPSQMWYGTHTAKDKATCKGAQVTRSNSGPRPSTRPVRSNSAPAPSHPRGRTGRRWGDAAKSHESPEQQSERGQVQSPPKKRVCAGTSETRADPGTCYLRSSHAPACSQQPHVRSARHPESPSS